MSSTLHSSASIFQMSLAFKFFLPEVRTKELDPYNNRCFAPVKPKSPGSISVMTWISSVALAYIDEKVVISEGKQKFSKINAILAAK